MTHPQQQSEPGQGPKKRKQLWIVGGIVAAIVVTVIVVVVVVIASIVGSSSEGPTAQADGGPAGPLAPVPGGAPAGPLAPVPGGDEAVTITYEVDGDDDRAGYIIYSADENLNLSRQNGVALPWTAEVPFPGNFPLATLALTAQSGAAGPDEITCRILRDDEVISEVTSSGPYAVVTCSGS